jgi:hypothetical protein
MAAPRARWSIDAMKLLLSPHPLRLRHLVAAAVATSALALAGPVAGANAAVLPALPATLPAALPVPTLPLAGNAIGGNQIGTAGCVGTNRPSVGGNNGSTANQNCGQALAFTGPAIGQISSIVGPTIIGSPLAKVISSAGPITAPVQAP